MNWDEWLPATRGDLKRLWSYVLDQMESITMIGEQTMARVDEVVTRLSAATDEIARDLSALRDEVANLDAGVAAKFEPLVTRLEEMGQDPQNPVPDAPADNGGTDVVNPTPGSEG